MNKDLIDALATHADFHVGNEHYDKSHEEQQRIFLERFAELIVQECLELVAGFYYYDDRTCHYARPRIRQHFGIEQ